ncbi:hypothetical protein [Paenimyroides baculatum]|uniref:hypothetical protein n=1 Tax=Paenimyroides baculatum TaxID=2608000 RepID=UPI0016813B93|nr:hypothetical protein [Paenimyroides baculatum]
MSICYGQHIYLQEVTENVQILLSVIDSGTGIAEKYLSAIFTYEDPIFQGIWKKAWD